MGTTADLSVAKLKSTYYARLELASAPWLERISTYVTSDTEFNSYVMTGAVPRMQEAIGPIVAPPLTTSKVEIINKDYRNAMRVDKKDWRREQTGQIMARVSEFADTDLEHWLMLCTELIANGEVGLCYTGQPFFSESHLEGKSGTYSNLLDADDVPSLAVADLDAITPYEFANAVLDVLPKFYAFKDDQARPRNQLARQFLVTVPISLMSIASKAFSNTTLETGSGSKDNPLKGQTKFTIDWEVNPELAWTTDFTVSRTDGTVKSVVRQEEVAAQLKVFGPGTEYWELQDHMLLKIDTSRNVGYGAPWTSIKAQFEEAE